MEKNQANFAGRNNMLRVLIDYTDTTGERRSVEKNVSIQFRTDTTGTAASGTRGSTSQTGFFSSWPFYIIVALAIAVGFYYRRRIAAILPKNK